MKDKTAFPKVGDNILTYVGDGCAHPDPKYTKMMPKGTMGRGSSPTGTTGNRSANMIHEAHGPACCIKATLYKPNAAEASATQRNVKIMPSAVGVNDFWKSKRTYNQAV